MSYPVKSAKIQLIIPVNFDGKEIKELEIRRPTLRDNMIANKSSEHNEDKDVMLMSLLCSCEQDLILDLDMADVIQIQEAIANFR